MTDETRPTLEDIINKYGLTLWSTAYVYTRRGEFQWHIKY